MSPRRLTANDYSVLASSLAATYLADVDGFSNVSERAALLALAALTTGPEPVPIADIAKVLGQAESTVRRHLRGWWLVEQVRGGFRLKVDEQLADYAAAHPEGS